VIRFCYYALVAIAALIGPRSLGLVGDASASFSVGAIDLSQATAERSDSSADSGAEAPVAPSDERPTKP